MLHSSLLVSLISEPARTRSILLVDILLSMSDTFHANFPRVFSKYRPSSTTRITGSVSEQNWPSTLTGILSITTLGPDGEAVELESKVASEDNELQEVWLDESQDWSLACVRLRAQSIFPALDLHSLPQLPSTEYEVLCDRAQYELCSLVNDSLVALDTPGAT